MKAFLTISFFWISMLVSSHSQAMSDESFIQNIQVSLNSEKITNSLIALRQVGGTYSSNQLLPIVESAIPLLQFYSRELATQGIPPYYSIIPIVESRNRPDALSPMGALGVWQLMPGTAVNYGGQLNQFIDERQSIIHSTKYASRFLKNLLIQFEDPIYVLAAYNWGPANVHRIKGSFLYPGQLLTSTLVPNETKNYVRTILAYWDSIRRVTPSDRIMNYPNVNYLRTTYDGATSILANSKVNAQLNLSNYNGSDRLVPTEYFEQYFDAYPIPKSSKPSITPKFISSFAENNKGNDCEENEELVSYQIYVVSQQDTLEKISKRFQVSTTEFLKRIPNPSIQPGKVLMIPDRLNRSACN